MSIFQIFIFQVEHLCEVDHPKKGQVMYYLALCLQPLAKIKVLAFHAKTDVLLDVSHVWKEAV